MRAIAILNAKAGLVLQHGETIADAVRDGFRACGHTIDVACVAPEQIENVKINMTIFDGRVIYPSPR